MERGFRGGGTPPNNPLSPAGRAPTQSNREPQLLGKTYHPKSFPLRVSSPIPPGGRPLRVEKNFQCLGKLSTSLDVLKNRFATVIDADEEAAKILATAQAEVVEAKKEQASVEKEIERIRGEYKEKREIFNKLQEQCRIYENRLEDIDIGILDPEFEFDDPEEYKAAIVDIRNRQKEAISNGSAITCSIKWTVDNSRAKGERMTKANMRLTMKAFNNECDIIAQSVTWRNFNQSKAKIEKAYEFFNKYNEQNAITITSRYLRMKLDELSLAFKQKESRQKAKEEQQALREIMREEERLQKEALDAQREEERAKDLWEKAKAKAEKASGEKVDELNREVERLAQELAEAQAKNERAISMAQQTRAGHVYIISNIGSFGGNMLKIGMTRRLDPYDRVKELGDASVPFEFDVHALISSTDAPALENKLHSIFERQRVNLVNNRKEFFRVSIDDVKTEVKKLEPKAEFAMTALAEQYWKSEAIRKKQVEEQSANVENDFPEDI